ncbi:UDP-glycosyltransferase UGT5-like [Plodia interpunctella]|uniref:UDP-glycosyltransferase UGT5-like n=1 Tax=Plodia interpunctella TaxID=58824 RepID=UPI002368062F|nr:UDP-glycosyltransferase UGT5-like [Plodia interpunctella]
MFTLFWLTLLCSVLENDAARILAVFPTPSISHQVTFRPLTQELVRRGHEVVVITADPAFPNGNRPDNLTEIDVHDISYKLWNERLTNETVRFGNKDGLRNQLDIIFEVMMKVFEEQIKVEAVQNIINNKTGPFDLIIVEAFVLPTLGFSHVFKVPLIQMSSFLPLYIDMQNVGAPNHPILYPNFGSQKLDNLSLGERIKTLLVYHLINMKKYEDVIDGVIKKSFGPNTPSVTELYNNIDMLFLNTFPIWDSNRPVPPNVQYIGGIHINTPKELTQDLQTYLDSSKYGVIYVSFGSNVSPSTLAPEKIQIFLNVLSRLPYDVIWKWDKDELPGRSKNIKISKWLPQSDLLNHPKIKLFVTQGGLQSTDEAIAAGVPLLGIPLLADQWYNVAMYVRHKIGILVNLEDLSEENFEAAIEALATDTYKQNMIKFRAMIYDQPQKPLERAVWWTEHVLRHGGGRHLRSPAANMSWAAYYEADVIFYLVLAAIPVLYLLTSAITEISSCFRKTKKAPSA